MNLKHVGGGSMVFRRAGCLTILLLLSGIGLTTPWAPGPLHAQERGWSEPVSLSENHPTSYLPDIAADRAGNLYVVWDVQFEYRDAGWGDGIGFAMWDGTSWSPGMDISTEITHLPSIAVDSEGRVHLIGIGRSTLKYSQAWAQQRPADARRWSTPVQLSNSLVTYWNDIVVDSRDWLHVVFAGSDPTYDSAIIDGQCVGEGCHWAYYTRSTDGGESWSTPVRISPPLFSEPRLQITVDNRDDLYVIWDTEWAAPGGSFIPSANGFTYSLDTGASWSEAETQVFDTQGGELGHSNAYGLNIAVDSKQTIHLVTVLRAIQVRDTPLGVEGSYRHLYRQGLSGSWLEEPIPLLEAEGLTQNYAYRAIAVDSNDTLHFVLPTRKSPDSQTSVGLFYIVWDGTHGWSRWTRVTTNTRGNGSGLGNLTISGGNQLHVVWFEHLEGSSGFLFDFPRGRMEILHASHDTGSRAILHAPLLPLPTAAPQSGSAPTATGMVPDSSIGSRHPTKWSGPGSLAEDSDDARQGPVALLIGVGLSGVVMGLVVAFFSFLRSHR